MNSERVVSIIVAFACIAAMGVASTTLESSLSSTPDDAIDYENIPIGKDQANEVKQDVQNNEQNGQSQSSSSSAAAASKQQKKETESLLDMLLALLKELLPYIMGGLVVLTVVGLAYRYRRRLIAPFLALVPSFGGGSTDKTEATVEWQPRNDIERTWLDLLQTAGVEQPQSKTPAECADDAVASGYDPEPVHSLRRAFEEVRYGEATLTDAHREQASQSRRQLGLGGNP